MRTKQLLPLFVHLVAVTACSSAEEEATGSVSQRVMVDFAELSEYRQMDGTGNNLQDPDVGSAGSVLTRMSAPSYEDGSGTPAGPTRPGAREVSNAVVAQSTSVPNALEATDMFWLWGQFVDHDLDLTTGGSESMNIPVPAGDAFFDPNNTGQEVIPFKRSAFSMVSGVREHENVITAYLDGSNVYGSTEEEALALRTLDGSGKLLTSAGNLLPMDGSGFFMAGDERANENIYLTAMHTLFMREHNYWAGFFKSQRPYMTGDELYSLARAVVGAEIQAITYNEFLPLLLGADALPLYTGYKANVDPGISTEFATAAYRFGHSMLNGTLQRLQADGSSIPEGPIELRDAFFNPPAFTESGLVPLLRGAAGQTAQALDEQIVDDVRNFLFGEPGQGGLDLASLNVQRGRDHGLGSYTEIRASLGLSPVTSFADITSDSAVRTKLESVYQSVEDVDLWIGGLAEDEVPGSMVGETFQAILVDQFTRLRDGDRFFYEAYLPPNMLTAVNNTRLSTVIRRNTEVTVSDLQHEVMQQPKVAESTLFGFEAVSDWNVQNGVISGNQDAKTDGDASLSLAGTGQVAISNKVPFAASELVGSAGIDVDVYVPEQVYNYYNAGSVQGFLTCPSAYVYQAFLGYVDLTYMPRGQFNTVSLDIPAYAQAGLAQNQNAGCTLTIGVNLDGTITPYALDRLRSR